MRRCLQQGRGELVASLFVLAVGLAVGLLTMDRSASWWDCPEFITTSYLLQVGHPPGAPTYQLLAHLFTLLAFGNSMLVAPMSNLLSVVATALTAMLVCRTVSLLAGGRRGVVGGVVGGLCYLLCDTVWFSAVESEVYALAMSFASLEVWLALRWRQGGNARLLPLIALLAGLGVGVHLLTLLALPAVGWIVLNGERRTESGEQTAAKRYPLSTIHYPLIFFLLGLSTYAIIPIRAAANPPINEGNPSTAKAFAAYLRRDQYVKAPHLYPRMWREADSANAAQWSGGRTDLLGNLRYMATYQMGYMYGRYLMYNFIGRENLKSHNAVPFILPFLLGLLGLWHQMRRRRRDLWPVLMLFLLGGPLLGIYLNHPCYEPRERDYAYILSFYAFALWIGVGAACLIGERRTENGNHAAAKHRPHGGRGRPRSRILSAFSTLILIAAPLSLAVGNWTDHDRHDCHSVHDIALAHLQSCDHGALLFTLGDNDTFPLWYLQQVEGRRRDIEVHNLNLDGYAHCRELAGAAMAGRPVYLSHYAYTAVGPLFGRHFRCEGFCHRVVGTAAESADLAPLRRHEADSIVWHITPREYVDPISASFLRIWQTNTRPAHDGQ